MVNIATIDLSDNGLGRPAVDAIIDEVHKPRNGYANNKVNALSLGGNNATPSAAALAKVQTLRNATYQWTVTCNGC